MLLYICICVYIYVYIHIYIYVHTYVIHYFLLRIQGYNARIHTHTHIYIHAHLYTRARIFIIYVCLYSAALLKALLINGAQRVWHQPVPSPHGTNYFSRVKVSCHTCEVLLRKKILALGAYRRKICMNQYIYMRVCVFVRACVPAFVCVHVCVYSCV